LEEEGDVRVGSFLEDLDEPQRRERALALAALCVGGIVAPKCVDDPVLADDLRRAAHRQALHIGGWTAHTLGRRLTMPQAGRSPNVDLQVLIDQRFVVVVA
jgi:hypothetical protein